MAKGDRIEVVKKESDLEGWTTGTVLDKVHDKISVSFDGNPQVSLTLPCSSREIAPYGTYTEGNEWRLKLSKGDLIDCLDTSGCWYRSTVLEADYAVPVPKVYVGYRVYQEDGKKKDVDGRTFQGWSKSFDEWLEVFSLRVQLAGCMSKDGYMECRTGDREYDKLAIDDSRDMLMNSPRGVKTFCVQRQEKESPEIVVNLLNAFGAEGGFDKIIARLSDKERPLPFGIVSSKE